jgi:hypothetical protein
MYGPKNRLRRSSRYALGELAEKQPAASSTKGVVGSTGTMMPTAPSASNKHPHTVRIVRFMISSPAYAFLSFIFSFVLLPHINSS